MKTLEQQLGGAEKLEIIGTGPEGTREEIARYYHEKVFEKLPVFLISYIIELVEEVEEKARHKKGISHLDLTFLLGRIDEKLRDPRMKEKFFPPEIFGFYGERMMRDFLREFEEVEAVERATEEEDWRQRIDIFVKFQGVDRPLAIQFTFEDYEKKKNLYGMKTSIKKANPKSKINPRESAECSLVLVRGNSKIFDKACDEWFRKSREEPEKKAINYLSEKEKLHLVLQLLRTENEEQKEVIEKMADPYLRKFFKKYCPGQKNFEEKLIPLSKFNPGALEELIEFVHGTKDRELF